MPLWSHKVLKLDRRLLHLAHEMYYDVETQEVRHLAIYYVIMSFPTQRGRSCSLYKRYQRALEALRP